MMYTMLIDTEFFGMNIYNFGGIVIKRNKDNFEIVEKFNYIINENLVKGLLTNNKDIHDGGLFNKKKFTILKDFYLQNVKKDYNKKYNFVSMDEFKTKFIEIISKYKIKYIYGYNVYAAEVARMNKIFLNDELNNIIFIDLLINFKYLIAKTKKYEKFCIDNNLLTEKQKNVKTDAETAYKFITKDLTFCEDHTALSDCICEYEIMKKLLKLHKKIYLRKGIGLKESIKK